MFLIGLAVVLFFAIQPLRNANKIFLLFTRIRGEQLNFFVRHFQLLYQRVSEEKASGDSAEFYSIFENLESKTRRLNDTERQVYRNVSTKVPSPFFGWLVRFCIITSLVVLSLGLKFYLTGQMITELYNQFYFLKNNVFFDLNTALATMVVSKQLQLSALGSEAAAEIALNSALFERVLNRTEVLGFALHLSPLMTRTAEFAELTKKLTMESSCEVVEGMRPYCNNSFVRNAMSNGLREATTQFNVVLGSARKVFTLDPDQMRDALLRDFLGTQLYQLHLLSFP